MEKNRFFFFFLVKKVDKWAIVNRVLFISLILRYRKFWEILSKISKIRSNLHFLEKQKFPFFFFLKLWSKKRQILSENQITGSKCVRVRKAIATAELGNGGGKNFLKSKISGSWSDVSGSGHVV